jgi:cytochrome P450
MQKAVDLHPPVTDWTTDWDHLDPQWQENPFPIWDMLREKCPIAHTKRFLGAYLPTSYEAVKAIAYDSEHFSSRRVIVRDVRPEIVNSSPPITSDPPHHKPAKQALLPPFTPDAMKKLEPKARAICNDLIDKFAGESLVDAAQAYSRHIPTRVIAHMLGVPETDSDLFIKWIHEILEVGIKDDDVLMKAVMEMSHYFAGYVQKYAQNPADNLISQLLATKGPDGNPFPPEHVLGTLRLLLIAGIDTTWSAIGASMWHLAKTPADRKRLIAEPQIMPLAIEEFLRAYAPVTMAREVIKDTTIAGCPIKSGNMILLSFPAANRDPKMFADPDKVILDRKENRHGAFGLGIHRCVGSNLARMEMTVALEEWLKRIPEFRLDPSADVKWSEGTVRGPRALPLILGK